MKIDIKNPIVSSLFSTIFTFILSMIIFYISKPNCILKISDKGIKIKDYYLLISYSLLFGVFTGVVVLLVTADLNVKLKFKSYRQKNHYSPV
jgi:hypothetical protein